MFFESRMLHVDAFFRENMHACLFVRYAIPLGRRLYLAKALLRGRKHFPESMMMCQ